MRRIFQFQQIPRTISSIIPSIRNPSMLYRVRERDKLEWYSVLKGNSIVSIKSLLRTRPNQLISWWRTYPGGGDEIQHIISVGMTGLGRGEFMYTQGIAIQEHTSHIYIADYYCNRIQIFSDSGEYIKQFGNQHLKGPSGVLIHQNCVYVTELRAHSVSMFELPEYTLIKRVGKYGDGIEEFNSPRQLTISPDQLLYVADSDNDRIQFLDAKLDFKGSLKHKSMTSPVDVKFSAIQMFVLSSMDSPCLHIFTHTGEILRSIITLGDDLQVKGSCFFCLDALNNILISDQLADDIKIFSLEGDLLYTVGEPEYGPGMFTFSSGIAILNQTKLVCVSQNYKYRLQILFA